MRISEGQQSLSQQGDQSQYSGNGDNSHISHCSTASAPGGKARVLSGTGVVGIISATMLRLRKYVAVCAGVVFGDKRTHAAVVAGVAALGVVSVAF